MVTILGANSVSGYNITNSLRFNDDDSPLLTKQFGKAPTNAQKCTFSMWYKMTAVAASTSHIYRYNDGSDTGGFNIRSDDFPQFFFTDSGGGSVNLNANPTAQRDPSAWYHVVIACDTTLSTATNRARMYINGVEQTTFATDTAPGQNTTLIHNANGETYFIGGDGQANNRYWDGCLADFYLVDGQQLEPTDFGEYNNDGVWIPINYTGSCGDNGFKLEFKATGTSQNAAGIGADTSGSGNHFAVANLAATDVTTDTPTNNFCTLNSLDIDSTLPTLAEGNLDYHSANGTAFNPVRSTMAVTKGKWYAEWKYINTAGFLGVISTQSPLTGNIASDADVRSILRIPAGLYAGRNNSGGFTDVGDNSQTFSDNDIGQVALDMDNGFVYFGINGTYLKGQDGSTTGDPAANNGGAGGSANHPSQLMTAQHDGVIAFMAGDFTQNTTGQIQCNFGNPPYAISSGNTDGEGHGNFEFAPPSGFFALCTKNLGKYG